MPEETSAQPAPAPIVPEPEPMSRPVTLMIRAGGVGAGPPWDRATIVRVPGEAAVPAHPSGVLWLRYWLGETTGHVADAVARFLPDLPANRATDIAQHFPRRKAQDEDPEAPRYMGVRVAPGLDLALVNPHAAIVRRAHPVLAPFYTRHAAHIGGANAPRNWFTAPDTETPPPLVRWLGQGFRYRALTGPPDAGFPPAVPSGIPRLLADSILAPDGPRWEIVAPRPGGMGQAANINVFGVYGMWDPITFLDPAFPLMVIWVSSYHLMLASPLERRLYMPSCGAIAQGPIASKISILHFFMAMAMAMPRMFTYLAEHVDGSESRRAVGAPSPGLTCRVQTSGLSHYDRLQSEARRLEDEAKRVRVTLEKTPREQYAPYDLAEAVEKARAELELVVETVGLMQSGRTSGAPILWVRTKPITAVLRWAASSDHKGFRHIRLGRYDIVIIITSDPGNFAIMIYPGPGEHLIGNHAHPHVRGDGQACWGDTRIGPYHLRADQQVAHLIRCGNLLEAVLLVVGYLSNPQSSGAYIAPENWPEVTEDGALIPNPREGAVPQAGFNPPDAVVPGGEDPATITARLQAEMVAEAAAEAESDLLDEDWEPDDSYDYEDGD
jgi:hypothetical protein